MADKIVFFNTGWMDFYQDLLNDTISGGGKYVAEMGFGYEIMNFKPFGGTLYGYVQPVIKKGRPFESGTIAIEKLGASSTDNEIDGVTVVWLATDPMSGGTYIVGWYLDATVYRYHHTPPPMASRVYKNETLGYYAKTDAENGKLLPKDGRNMSVKRGVKNWLGQSNVWYAENNPDFVRLVKEYIQRDGLPINKDDSSTKGKAGQPDPLKRIEVEKRAIQTVTNHYVKLGYTIESFEKDNLGWDLTATNEKVRLKLEVKGLSGETISTELTPNEYKNLQADLVFYRLCIVTNTLLKPVLAIFSYSNEMGAWTSEEGKILQFEPVVSARVFL